MLFPMDWEILTLSKKLILDQTAHLETHARCNYS
jgi:hypothetical protein